MKITVQRFRFGDTATIGKLLVDDKFFCWTLEDKVRPPSEPKVFGQTAIPYGTYNVTITPSPHFGRLMPLLNNVQGFEGVRIHSGNKASDTEGCILVGFEHNDDTVLESRDAFNALYDQIDHRIREGDTVTVQVTK